MTCGSTLLLRARDHSDHACHDVSRCSAYSASSRSLLRSSGPSPVERANILDRLLAVQHQTQQCAQRSLHLFRRNILLHSSLQILRTNVCKLSREVLGKSRSEHYDELRPKSQHSPCPLNWFATRVSQARHCAFYKVANVQRCLDCRRKCLHEVVRVPSWAWEGRPWVVVRPFWLLSLLSGRWARVSSPPPLAQMTVRCYRSRTSSQ